MQQCVSRVVVVSIYVRHDNNSHRRIAARKAAARNSARRGGMSSHRPQNGVAKRITSRVAYGGSRHLYLNVVAACAQNSAAA